MKSVDDRLNHLPLFREYPLLRDHLPHVSLATLPTPVEKLEAIGQEIGLNNLYIKRDDLSGTIYGGNKVRILEFLLGNIIHHSDTKEIITIGFAGSNHALATALYANQLGMRCTSMLMQQANAHYVRRNLLASHYFNANLRFYKNPPMLALGVLGLLLKSKLRQGTFPKLIPAGGTCPLGIMGCVNAALELKDQINAGLLPEPDLIYVTLGSMGTAAGLIVGIKAAGLKTRVVAVRVIEEKMAHPGRMLRYCKQTAAQLHKFDPTFPPLAITAADLIIRNEYMGAGYAQFTAQAVRAADFMREKTGITMNGTYTAKTFSALLDDANNNRLIGKSILFWNTYNSRSLSGFTDNVDYQQLPPAFHRYFETDVQPLDNGNDR